MQWILATGYTFLILAILPRISFFKLPSIPMRWLQGAFLIKVLAGIALGIIYSRYYTDRTTADTFKFFDDSRIIFNAIKENPGDFFRMMTGYHSNAPDLVKEYYVNMTAWNNKEMFFNDNRSIIRLNVLFRFISLGNYYVHVVLLNLFSFTGLVCFYKAFVPYLGNKQKLLFCGLVLFPSLLFWGFGMLKDSLLLFSVGLCILSFLNLNVRFSYLNLTGLLLGIGGLMLNKFYIFLLLFPGLIAYFFSRKNSQNTFWIFTGTYLLFGIMVLMAKYISPHLDFMAILEMKRHAFEAIAISGKALHRLELPADPLTLSSFIQQIPRAFFTVLFRPFVWESDSIPVFFSAMENLVLLLAIPLAFIFPSGKNRNNLLLILSLFFIFSLFVLIGMITPILGAIVRYRIIAIPFILFVFIYFIDTSRLFSVFYKKSTALST